MPTFQFAVPTTRIATIHAESEEAARALLGNPEEYWVQWGAQTFATSNAVLISQPN